MWYKNVWKNHGILLTFLHNDLRIDCILVVKHPDDGHGSDRNVLVKNNNLWFSIFINVNLLVYPVCIIQELYNLLYQLVILEWREKKMKWMYPISRFWIRQIHAEF